MVFGIPKSGKSILCTQLARYLADNFGSVLYVAAEEGFSLTLQNKLREFGAECENLHYANFRDFEQIRTALRNNDFQFVFLDSVNFMKITPEQLRLLKQENQGVSFITIQQATKDGKFRGSQEYAHDADIIINVAQGEAHQQGRFREPSVMRVFKKGTYNPEPEYADDGEDDDEPATKENAPFSGGDFQVGSDLGY
jgi:predicted ATP-dependent serine protease